MSDDPGPSPTGPPDDEDEEAARRYLDEVRRQIDDEVRRRRVSGDLPLDVERELDQQFLRHSPLGGRGAALRDMLRLVDASVFIDPVVPIESRRPGGTTVKRGLRSLSLWYLRYVTHQVSEFATAVSRALHVLDAQVTDLRRAVDALPGRAARSTVEVAWAHHPGAWWVEAVTDELAGTPGRASCTPRAETDGSWAPSSNGAWTPTASTPATGSGPTSSTPSTCASRTSPSTSGPSPRARSRAVVLSGVVEGSGPAERARLLEEARALPGAVRSPVRPFPQPGQLGGRRRAARGRLGLGPALPTADVDRAVLEDLGLDATVAEGPARARLPRDRPPGGGRPGPG